VGVERQWEPGTSFSCDIAYGRALNPDYLIFVSKMFKDNSHLC